MDKLTVAKLKLVRCFKTGIEQVKTGTKKIKIKKLENLLKLPCLQINVNYFVMCQSVFIQL